MLRSRICSVTSRRHLIRKPCKINQNIAVHYKRFREEETLYLRGKINTKTFLKPPITVEKSPSFKSRLEITSILVKKTRWSYKKCKKINLNVIHRQSLEQEDQVDELLDTVDRIGNHSKLINKALDEDKKLLSTLDRKVLRT